MENLWLILVNTIGLLEDFYTWPFPTPNIGYALNKLSQYMSAPCTPHLDAIHHLLRYLKATPGQGIMFSPAFELSLKAYADVE